LQSDWDRRGKKKRELQVGGKEVKVREFFIFLRVREIQKTDTMPEVGTPTCQHAGENSGEKKRGGGGLTEMENGLEKG